MVLSKQGEERAKQGKCPEDIDVLVIGAGVAGCAAALLLSGKGLRVMVVEEKAMPEDFKKLCTTFIQPSAWPVLEKMKLTEELEQAGGVLNSASFWTCYGWVHAPQTSAMQAVPPHGFSVRREILDPFLRGKLMEREDIDLRMGMRVTGLEREEGRYNRAVLQQIAGGATCHGTGGKGRVSVTARLIVLADGRHSKTVEMAKIPTRTRANHRAVFFAYYKNLPLKSGQTSQFWSLDPDFAFAYPFDNGLTMLCLYVPRDKAKSMAHDIDTHFETLFPSLPKGPSMQDAQRVSKVRRMFNIPNNSRPAAFKGMALIGDAALSSDPVAGIGCGWALQGADWMVSQCLPVLTDKSLSRKAAIKALDQALERYRRLHRRRLGPHHYFIADASSGRKMNLMERMVARAAAHDEKTAERLHLYTARLRGPGTLLSPASLLRIAGVNLRLGFRLPAATTSAPAKQHQEEG